MIDSLLPDLKYGVRMLTKHPGYTALAVIALGLGIGANTAIFSMGYALLEKPVAVPEVKGLCAIDDIGRARRGSRWALRRPLLRIGRSRVKAFPSGRHLNTTIRIFRAQARPNGSRAFE